MFKPLFIIIIPLLITLILFFTIHPSLADSQIPAPLSAKTVTPSPTPDVLAYQSSGYGMSLLGVLLLLIFVAGLIFGYWRITH